MSGTGFVYLPAGDQKFVCFRIARHDNDRFVKRFEIFKNSYADERRERTCQGAKLAAKDETIVKRIFKEYSEGASKPQKTVKFTLTKDCANIVNDFRSNHPYIDSDELAFQVLLTIGVRYGDDNGAE